MTTDEAFFAEHPDRKARIRLPTSDQEFRKEFQSLGPHQYDRRRVIVAVLARSIARRYNRKVMEIPFLAFADEEIADRDEIVLPILREIMQDAAKEYGFK